MADEARRVLPWTFDTLEAVRRWPADRPLAVLHSGRPHPRWSRWSVLAEPAGAWVFDQGRSTLHGEVCLDAEQLSHRPFRDFATLTEEDRALWLGSLGYDLGRYVERLPEMASRDRRWPDATMLRCPGWLMYDRLTRQWSACGGWAEPNASARPDLASLEPCELAFTSGVPEAHITPSAYQAAVQRALDFIAAGDIFQVNLTQRFTADFQGAPRGLFSVLAERSPAWYGAYLECPWPSGGSAAGRPCWPAIISTSPELFFELDSQGGVVTRPIKGTRPASAPPNELRDSAKDAAELAMIVDLLRNDLGRVCSYGSIAVREPRTIEHHPTVQHGVATVTGRLHPSRGFADLLRAVFPGGSITGAPKVRAMQIIEELETVRRGPYCGAIGGVFPTPSHAIEATEPVPPRAVFNIAIRTMLVDESRVDFGVGGGVVADSTPEGEYRESLDKARAMLEALRTDRAAPQPSPPEATPAEARPATPV